MARWQNRRIRNGSEACPERRNLPRRAPRKQTPKHIQRNGVLFLSQRGLVFVFRHRERRCLRHGLRPPKAPICRCGRLSGARQGCVSASASHSDHLEAAPCTIGASRLAISKRRRTHAAGKQTRSMDDDAARRCPIQCGSSAAAPPPTARWPYPPENCQNVPLTRLRNVYEQPAPRPSPYALPRV